MNFSHNVEIAVFFRSSTSTKPTSPIAPTSTVITVNNSMSMGTVTENSKPPRRKSKDSGITQPLTSPPHVTASKLESPIEEMGGGSSPTNTHIIKVSGPITNLDETVTSGEPISEVHQEGSEAQNEVQNAAVLPKILQTSV